MQILLANAKIMYEKADWKPLTTPLFQSVANTLADEMAQMDVNELAANWIATRRLPQRTGSGIRIFTSRRRCRPFLPTTVRHTSTCVPAH